MTEGADCDEPQPSSIRSREEVDLERVTTSTGCSSLYPIAGNSGRDPRYGGTPYQQRVLAGCGDLERALGLRLAFDVGEVGIVIVV